MKSKNFIEIDHGDKLVFHFNDIKGKPKLELSFQRTLRVPDSGEVNYLPPGLGRFELRHIADYADKLPASWVKHGGVLLPMWQAEAMWLNFDSEDDWPFALKVGAGKICAVTGESWSRGLRQITSYSKEDGLESTQNYLPIPAQPWLDGFCTAQGEVRQFVAAPLGSGLTVEEQLTGEAQCGGIQLEVYPLKEFRRRNYDVHYCCEPCYGAPPNTEMGLGAGGRIRQKIEEDEHNLEEYEIEHPLRVFVHLLNSEHWREVTGEAMPQKPLDAADYTEHGLPWFDYYSDGMGVGATDTLKEIKSVNELAGQGKEKPLEVASSQLVKLYHKKHVRVESAEF